MTGENTILRDKDSKNIIRTPHVENIKLFMDADSFDDIEPGTLLIHKSDDVYQPIADADPDDYVPGLVYISVNYANAAKGLVSYYSGAADPEEDDDLEESLRGKIGAVNVAADWYGCIYGNHEATAVTVGEELTIDSGEFVITTEDASEHVVAIVTKANTDSTTSDTRWYVTTRGAGYISQKTA